MITIDLSILNQKGTPMFYSDIFADRPPFGIAGRIFISTDTKEFYRDTGSSWELLAGPGGGTITGSGTATQVAFFNSSSSITGNNDLWWDNSNSRLGIGNNNPASNLDIHGNNATIQIDGRSTSSAFVQFVTQGVLKWRIGNLSPSNYFQIYDNANSLERVKLENTGLFTLTGKINNNETTTAVANDGWYGVYSNEDITINAAQTFTGGNSFGSLVGRNFMRYQGNATFPNAAVPASILGTNVFNFPNAGSTITITQGTGVRAFSAINAFNQLNSVNSGTITHIAGLHVLAPYRATGGVDLTCTNYYGLLINASNERTAFTITNSWGIYQEGSSDKNYLNGTTLIGTNVDTLSGAKLQVNGAATFSSSVTANQLIASNTAPQVDLLFSGNTAFKHSIVGSNYSSSPASSNTLTFKVANGANTQIDAMILNGAGNLGLGVTPSAWNSAIRAIELGSLGGTVITGNTSAGGSSIFGQNFYFDSGFKYSANGVSSYYLQNGGSHVWYTAPSGTAGNAITFTQAMTLNASGNLGITGSSFDINPASGNPNITLRSGNTFRGYIEANTTGLQFGVGASATIYATITSSGRTLIGTQTDNTVDLLQVAGSGRFSSSVTSNGNTNGQIAISPSTNTNAAAFVASNAGGNCYFGKNNSTGGAFTGTAYATVVYSGGDVPMSFYTNDTERMRINSAGGIEMKDSLKLTNFTTSGTAGSIVNYVQITVGTTNYLLPLYNLP